MCTRKTLWYNAGNNSLEKSMAQQKQSGKYPPKVQIAMKGKKKAKK